MKVIFLNKTTQAVSSGNNDMGLGAKAQNVDFEETCSTGIKYFIVLLYLVTNSGLPTNT
jgi:hypothetical protein